ncbi:MAG TPA: type II toxin-antitoxin system ParD family antitoxin [Bosea sp. (in: a-proteobacteria)]|jgi:antitoxin ParD1/3/4|nr:type II toxin-antitoxin system ParD family antitoxin [Bosea sp. (in: a-proteobacteria)]
MASSYTIGSRYENLVKDLVTSGRYATASEVVREGLRLVEEREELRQIKLQALRDAIREGMESGAAMSFDLQDILSEAKAQKRAAQG